MALFKWINSNLVMGLAIVCLVVVTTSSGFPQKKRDDSKPKTGPKTNFWIIQSPKRPLPGLGVEFPPASMLLMTIDPNATTIEPANSSNHHSESTIATTTEELVTSPGVDEISVTETLSTSTVGTEAGTASIPTTTTEESVTVPEETSSLPPQTEDVAIFTESPVPSPSIETEASNIDTGILNTDSQTTTEALELSTTTEAEATTQETWTEDSILQVDVITEGTNGDGSGDGNISTEAAEPTVNSDDVPEVLNSELTNGVHASEEATDTGSGVESEETTDAGSGSVQILVANDESDVETGSGTNPNDGSDAPPDVAPAALSDSSDSNELDVTTDSSSETENSTTEVAEAEAQFLVFTTEATPEDPGLTESVTEVIEFSRKNLETSKSATLVKTEDPTTPVVKNAGNSRHLLTVDIKAGLEDKEGKVMDEIVDVVQKSDDDKEEARQYYRRPYPIRPDQRPVRRPSSIDRHDQNFRPEYDNQDSNIIYRTYDYCFTLWCKFKTQLSRIGLL